MKMLSNKYTSYQLTDDEEIRGSILMYEQKMVIQNKLSEAALAKSVLKLDPEHPLPYAQQEAFLAGQIEILEYQLDNSDSMEMLQQERLSHEPQPTEG